MKKIIERLGLSVLLLLILLWAGLDALGQPDHQPATIKLSPEGAVDKILRTIGSSHQGVEVRLHGSCASGAVPIDIPSITWQDPVRARDAAVAIRDALRANEQLSVARVSRHVIVVKDAGVRNEVLDTRIRTLELNSESWSPTMIVMIAIRSQEVQETMRQKGIKTPISNGGLAGGVRGLHMPRRIENATLGEVFNAVLRKFGGIVLYDDCSSPDGKALLYVHYYYNLPAK
jgi:hypothetical protein